MNGVSVNMDFETFVSETEKQVGERCSECVVKVSRVEKNNGLCLTGITIMPPDRRIAPTIYLESFYDNYRKGCPMDRVISGIIRMYEENMTEEDIDIPDVTDFGDVKDIICCRLVNYDRNRERLENMPHRIFLNLAVVYYLPVPIGPGCNGSITVTDRLAEMWKVDEETVYGQAIANTQRLFPATLKPMEEVLGEYLTEPVPAGLLMPLHVLRCGECNGAVAMLCGDILRDFAGKHGDFYLLPSSTHEVLLLPADGSREEGEHLCSMVREINCTQLSPDEVLADNAYLYHADTGNIEVLE